METDEIFKYIKAQCNYKAHIIKAQLNKEKEGNNHQNIGVNSASNTV